MAQYLVLQPYISGTQPAEHIPAGSLIESTQFPDFATMVASGLSVIPYDASQDAAIAAFNAQRTNPGALLLSLLTAAGVAAASDGAGLATGDPLTGGNVQADAASDKAKVVITAGGAGVINVHFSFCYSII